MRISTTLRMGRKKPANGRGSSSGCRPSSSGRKAGISRFMHNRLGIYGIYSLLIALLVSAVAAAIPAPAFAAMPNLQLEAESAILIEATSGKILFKKNENLPLPPASMTKMMTEYLVLEAIRDGKITWETKVTTSEYAGWMGKYGGSRVYLQPGSVHTVRELYEGMAVASGNDATVALAELLGGSETNFVKMMNEKAKEFGMTSTHFLTSSGYPAEEIPEQYRPQLSGEHVMSARDSAILARRLILDFPESLEVSKKSQITFTEGGIERTFKNWNWMVPGLIYEYEGVDGLKTGHTDLAGYCFTGTAKRGDLRLISVVMKSSSEGKRFEDTRRLMDYGFSNFEMKQLIGKGETVKGRETVPVVKGKELEVSVVAQRPLLVAMKKGEAEKYEVVAEIDKNRTNEEGKIVAPVKKGDVVGRIGVKYQGGEKAEYVGNDGKNAETVPLVANEEVEKAGFIRLFFRGIGNFFGGLFESLADSVKNLFT
ncbi:D-alanyl-D-alanine carboxypeptidase family protein [Bacillaceae bacterium]